MDDCGKRRGICSLIKIREQGLCPAFIFMHTYSIRLSEQQINYTIRQSPKAKYIKLTIKNRALHVVIPSYIRLNDKTHSVIENFISQKSSWVLNRLSEAEEDTAPKKLIENNQVIYLGKTYDLSTNLVQKRKECRIEIDHAGNTLVIYNTNLENINTLLHDWYKNQAKEFITLRLKELNTFTTKQIKSIRIKNLRSRWGSCSSMGGLNFSWRLILAPVEIVDYVIIHELSHLNHMNHSQRFWQLVETQCPDYKSHINWLKKEGQKLLHVI